MASSPDSGDMTAPSGGRQEYTRYQRLLMYFRTKRRKVTAVVVVLVIWVLLQIAEIRAFGFGYAAIFVLAILFSQGALLRRPTKLPPDLMQNHADARYTRTEDWASSLSTPDALATIEEAFKDQGAHPRRLGDSVWIEFTGAWSPVSFRHRDVAKHLRINPSIHVFVYPRSGGSSIVAHSRDGRLAGMWDVMQLSDEMADAAVRRARDVTAHGSDGTAAEAPVGS